MGFGGFGLVESLFGGLIWRALGACQRESYRDNWGYHLFLFWLIRLQSPHSPPSRDEKLQG